MLTIILIILCAMAISIVIWTMRNKISPMPTAPRIKKKLLESLPEDFEGLIVELGSGWGTLAFALAAKYPHCQVVGYESSPIPYYYTRLLNILLGHKNLHFERKDFFAVPLDEARLAVCYLYPDAMKRLKEKFKRELTPGSLVVSHTFAIPGWPCDK